MLPLKDKIISISKDTVETLGFICLETKILTGKKNRILKTVVYKKKSDISMDDCSKVSNVLLRRLEIEFPEFSENYEMIVESPGVERKLTTIEELRIFDDKEIRFVVKNPDRYGLKDPIIIGNIISIEDKDIIINSKETKYRLNWGDVSARLYFDIKKYL